jgi:transposase-like protein
LASRFDCPFLSNSYGLAPTALNHEQKMWLVDQILSKRETAVSLSRRFGLSRVLINKYVSRVKQRGGLSDSNKGRPRCLDDIAVLHLVDDVIKSSPAVDQLTDFSQHIENEFHSTMVRRFPGQFEIEKSTNLCQERNESAGE